MYRISRTIRPYGAYMKSNFPVCHVGCIKHGCCGGINGINEHHCYYSKRTFQTIYQQSNNKNIYPSLWRPTYKFQDAYTLKSWNSLIIHRHSIHISCTLYDEVSKDKLKVAEIQDEKSKVEEYVEHQKQKIEKKNKMKTSSKKFQKAFIFKIDPSTTGQPAQSQSQPSAVTVPKKTLMAKIKHEVMHYYNGFKLLYFDTKIAARLLWRVLKGKNLTRREKKQLLRTTADLFRLVPFSVFLIIPFMEFLLPVAIKLFPGMLPSTFEDAKSKENKRKVSLKLKLQMAEFIQDTIEEIAVTEKGKKPNQKLLDFADFVQKTRTEADPPINSQIIKYSKLFEDEITLENIPYDHLKALSRIMMISSIGDFLGPDFVRYRIKLKMRELKADDEVIRREGIENLSNEELQNACVARGIRAFGVSVDRLRSNLEQWLELSLDQEIPASLLLLSRTFYIQDDQLDEQLKSTISQLPERLIDEVEVKIAAEEGEHVDRQTRLDILAHEEEQIKTEKIQRDKEKAEDEKQEGRKEEQFSKEELLTVKETLSVSDKEKLDKIKEEREDYIEDVQELKQVKKDVVENVASTRLGKRLDAMLKTVEQRLEEDKTSDLPSGKIDEDEDGIVTTEELLESINRLPNAPSIERTQHLIQLMDEDNDGIIDLDEMRTAVKLLDSEDLLSQVQIKEVLSLLKGLERIFVNEQIINKRKTNYLIMLLPSVYSRKCLDDFTNIKL